MSSTSEDSQERIVELALEPRPYSIFIAPGSLSQLGHRLREHAKGSRVLLVTDENVGPLYAEQAVTSLEGAGFAPTLATVPAGDTTKCFEWLRKLYDAAADARIDRTSPVVALGGGVVGDLAGLLASTWMRGVPYVQCPTTVEADVDASVGGKTAINHPSGKNMIGSFYQPMFVLIDTATLRTLSDRDFRAGLAESVKHAIIRDADFFDWHEQNVETVLGYDVDALGALVERNVQIKASIVAQDEREVSGMRALLNFGHTIGHTIESAIVRRGEPWRHGEALGVGMTAAAEMSVLAGKLDRPSADRIVALIERIGLPTQVELASCRGELEELMQLDKKVAAGRIRFVLAEGIGDASLCDQVDPKWIAAGFDRVLV